VRAGLLIPVGHNAEFVGWSPDAAWQRSVAVAQVAEELGFSALWAPDHVMNVRGRSEPDADLIFETFVFLTALAGQTQRATVGHLVMCAPFRHPAMVAKAIATLDVVSGGRAVCAIGAGWNRPEFEAYGFPFPPARERLALLREHLEVLTRMLGPGRATFEGKHVQVVNAPNEPKGLGRIPIVVGGNGPNVTWRLAARYADELNINGLDVEAIAASLPVIRSHCEEVGRDPATLAVSGLFFFSTERSERVDQLGRLVELGYVRVDTTDDRLTPSDDWLHEYVEDLRTAGVQLDGEVDVAAEEPRDSTNRASA
jgi:alkanesulfonate monooxygenase SsuD/methylene tetrahydromethanopterin reductase-like flavin-dependent oxidoreductase (luciferase family)